MQIIGAILPQHVASVFAVARPVNEHEASGAKYRHHIGAQCQPGLVIVAAPDNPFAAIKAGPQGVNRISVTMRGFRVLCPARH
jgi:hypothetical protein